MALNIKDPSTDKLARELAALTGESITEALHAAIELRLARERARRRATPTHATLDAIIRRGRQRKVLDSRTAEEILGYDDAGLPQ